MTPLVFCRFQPPQLLQPSQHIYPAGRQQIELNLNSAIGMDDHFVQQISAEQLIVGGCFTTLYIVTQHGFAENHSPFHLAGLPPFHTGRCFRLSSWAIEPMIDRRISESGSKVLKM